MYFISKAVKGHEYLYSRQFTIGCKSKKQAEQLAEHLNNNNNTCLGIWKLKDNEIWHVYEQDIADSILYKLVNTKGKISIRLND